MKSFTKIVGSITRAVTIPVLCSLLAQPVTQQIIRLDPTPHLTALADRQISDRPSVRQRVAQADANPSPAAASAPQATIVYGGMHNIAKENGGLKPWLKPVPGTLKAPEGRLPNASAPPIHGSDEAPPGYPNYDPPLPINQPNPYRQGIPAAPPND